MGGEITKPDVPVKYPALAELLAGLPPDTLIFFTIGGSAAQAVQPERVAILDAGVLPPQPQVERMQVVSPNGVYVRKLPSLSAEKIGAGLPGGAVVEVIGTIAADSYHWTQIQSGSFKGGYVAREFLKPL
jgi:hypothetical protein